MTPDAIGEGNDSPYRDCGKCPYLGGCSICAHPELRDLLYKIKDLEAEIERLRAAQPTILQGEGGSLAMTPAPQVQDGAIVPEIPADLQDEMTNIETLIGRLQKTKERFGNSCVYIRRGGLSWGAVALNYAADDKKHGVFDLQADHDRECERHAGQVQRLMAARDSEREARQNCAAALDAKDKAMSVLFDRLRAAGVDVSDLIS